MTDLLTFRPEIIRDVNSSDAPVVAKSLSLIERTYRLGFVRKGLILAVLAIAWEAYGRWLGNPLLFPTLARRSMPSSAISRAASFRSACWSRCRR